MVKPSIQFTQGSNEQTIPDVRLTKSRDGTNGVATFIFEQPSMFDSYPVNLEWSHQSDLVRHNLKFKPLILFLKSVILNLLSLMKEPS